MKRCTCDYGAGRACPGQAALGEGWYCAEGKRRAEEFALGLPVQLRASALAAVGRGARLEKDVLILRADGAVVRFGREP